MLYTQQVFHLGCLFFSSPFDTLLLFLLFIKKACNIVFQSSKFIFHGGVGGGGFRKNLKRQDDHNGQSCSNAAGVNGAFLRLLRGSRGKALEAPAILRYIPNVGKQLFLDYSVPGKCSKKFILKIDQLIGPPTCRGSYKITVVCQAGYPTVKACVCYFLSNFYFSPNNSPSKTMKNVYFI